LMLKEIVARGKRRQQEAAVGLSTVELKLKRGNLLSFKERCRSREVKGKGTEKKGRFTGFAPALVDYF